MSVATPAEKIRAAIDHISGPAMMPDSSDASQPPALGGVWRTPDEENYLSLASGRSLLLRDVPTSVPQWGPWLHWGTLKLNGLYINFCISRWIEEIAHPKPLPIPQGLAQPAALQLNLAIEQINHSSVEFPAVANLSNDDMEKVAGLVRPPMEQYLDRWVNYDRNIQEKFGRHAVPVIGKVHENWRRPRPQLAELHEHLAQYAASFSLERISTPTSDLYHVDKEDGRNVVRISGEPDILISLPEEDREYPRYYPGIVRIGSLEIQIDVNSLSSFRLDRPILGQSGIVIERVSLDMMTHPFSLRVKPQGKLPAGLDMDTADHAIQYMRIAWLKYLNNRLEKTSKRADVIII